MSGSLPQTIPPQTAPIGKANEDGDVIIDITWYLLFYNVITQTLSQANGSLVGTPTDLLLIDNVSSIELPSNSPAPISVDQDDSSADVAQLQAMLQALQMLVADINESLTAGDVIGPVSATGGNVAVFNGATGKIIKDGGTLGTAAFTVSTPWTTFNPVRTGWTDVGAPTVTGRKCQIGNVCYFQVKVVPATTVATVAGTSYVALPITAGSSGMGGGAKMDDITTMISVGNGVIDVTNSRVYVPTQTATADGLAISGYYEV